MAGREEEARNKLAQLQDSKIAADQEVKSLQLKKKTSSIRDSRLGKKKPPRICQGHLVFCTWVDSAAFRGIGMVRLMSPNTYFF